LPLLKHCQENSTFQYCYEQNPPADMTLGQFYPSPILPIFLSKNHISQFVYDFPSEHILTNYAPKFCKHLLYSPS